MDSIMTSFGQVLLWSFWFFIWIAALMVWFRCLLDLFRDSSLNGWAKAGWAVVLIFVPWLGALIYLIARGRSMTERQMAELSQRQAEQEKYIQQVARAPRGPQPSRSPAPRRCSTRESSPRPSSTRSRPRRSRDLTGVTARRPRKVFLAPGRQQVAGSFDLPR